MSYCPHRVPSPYRPAPLAVLGPPLDSSSLHTNILLARLGRELLQNGEIALRLFALTAIPGGASLPKRSDNSGKAQQITWTVWPAGQRPYAAAAALALVLAVSWYSYVEFGHPIYSIIALVVLTGSLTFFLFPTTYTLDREGIELRGFLHQKHKPWDDLGCFLRGDDFVAVSTSENPTERSISRGFVLRLGSNGDEVAQFLARHLPEWRKPPADGEADE